MCTKFRYNIFLKEATHPITVDSTLNLSQVLQILNLNGFVLLGDTIFSTDNIDTITRIAGDPYA